MKDLFHFGGNLKVDWDNKFDPFATLVESSRDIT